MVYLQNSFFSETLLVLYEAAERKRNHKVVGSSFYKKKRASRYEINIEPSYIVIFMNNGYSP